MIFNDLKKLEKELKKAEAANEFNNIEFEAHMALAEANGFINREALCVCNKELNDVYESSWRVMKARQAYKNALNLKEGK